MAHVAVDGSGVVLRVDIGGPGFPGALVGPDWLEVGRHALAGGQWVENPAWVAPPIPSSTQTPLTQAQWRYALRRNGLLAPLNAAIDALELADPVRAATLEAHVLGKDRYPFARVLSLLAYFADVLPPEIAGLTEAQIEAMWIDAQGAPL